MAEHDKNAQGSLPPVGGEETQPEWKLALEYVKENPTKVAGGIGFVLLCVAIGGLYSLKNMADDEKVTTEYAAALNTEDAELRAAALKEVADSGTRWSVEALYLTAETAIEAKSYDEARTAFEQVLAQHGDSDYAPMAADGLAFLDENEGKLEEALAGYTKVFETWDDTVTGRRQLLNMARVEEALGKHAEAVAHYQQQVEVFPESSVAGKAQVALDRLKSSMPELFPEEEADSEEAMTEAAPAEEAPAEEATAEAAPAEEAPAEAAPAEEATAEAAPAEEAPAEAAPAEAAPAEAAPAEEAPAEAAPAEEAPAEAAPAEAAPAEAPAE